MSAFAGRTVVVTGASSGIGREAARQLGAAGASLVLVGRNREATTALAAELRAPAVFCDFARLGSVRAAAARITGLVDRVDVLFSNAGAAVPDQQATVDGNELNFQINTLAPILLETLMQPLLHAASAGRVVATSSRSHRAATLHASSVALELQQASGGTHRRYARAKLAALLVHAHRRHTGQDVPLSDVHPGIVASGFGRYLGCFGAVLTAASRPVLRSPACAAVTLVDIAGLAPASGYRHRDRVREPSPLVGDEQLVAATAAYVSERLEGAPTR